MRGRPPPLLEWLLSRLYRRDDAEFVVGDAVERFQRDLADGKSRWKATRRLGHELLSAVRYGRARRQGADPHDPGPEGAGPMRGWWNDVRLAFRGVARRPGFAATVVLTLAVGIGATTTIFSVIDGVLFRPLPYDDPSELVAVGTTFPGREWDDAAADLQHLAGTSVLNYLDFRERSHTLAELSGVEVRSFLMPDEGNGPELVNAAAVTEDFFALLRVSPVLGRLFLPEEHVSGAQDVAVLSHDAWVTRYGADPGVLGGSIGRFGSPVTIVGVLPADFSPPEVVFGAANPPEFWTALRPVDPRYEERGRRSLTLLARLAAHATVEDARAELDGIADALAVEYPDGNVYPDGTHFGAGANSLHRQTVGTAGRSLGVFLAASGLLLLIAALNSATLLLARALDRLRELGVRTALGASRRSIMRLLLTESVVLSTLGGLVGIGIAYGGVELFLRYAPVSIPRISEVAVDARVLVVTVAVSIGAGLAAGLLPAARYAGAAPADRLRSGGSAAGSDSKLRAVLVAGQMALAVVLLAGAGLLGGSLQRLRTVDPGFEPEGLASFRVATKRPDMPPGERIWQGWDLIRDQTARIPGVRRVAVTSNLPFQSPWWAPRVLLPGDPDDLVREGVAGYAITPGYFRTAGTELLRGRDFRTTDGPDGPFVVIVNESFVAEHLTGRDPLGIMVHIPEGEYDAEIVGVVEDVIQGRAEEGGRPAVYFPYTQADMPFAQVVVRSDLPPEALFPELRAASRRFSPAVPPLDVSTMEQRMAATRTTPRFQAVLVGAFAAVALLLAATGLYGSLTHAVGRRRKELGIRMAVGAERTAVLGLVLAQGLRISAVGLALGLLVALGASRFLTTFLYGVEPTDPATYAGVALVLGGVAAVACVRPAVRATAVDPVEVLRAD